MQTSLYQITDDAQPSFRSPRFLLCALFGFFLLSIHSPFSLLLDSFTTRKIFSQQFLHEERNWRGFLLYLSNPMSCLNKLGYL